MSALVCLSVWCSKDRLRSLPRWRRTAPHASRSPHEGNLLDTAVACPPLDHDEERRCDELVKAAKRAAKPQAEAAAEKAAKTIAQQRSIDLDTAREVIAASLRGDLASNDLLELD